MRQYFKPTRIGVQRKDGTAEIIIILPFPCDPGDNFRTTMLKTINYRGGKAEFSYHNKLTGNCAYREL